MCLTNHYSNPAEAVGKQKLSSRSEVEAEAEGKQKPFASTSLNNKSTHLLVTFLSCTEDQIRISLLQIKNIVAFIPLS